jgi:glutaminase
MFLRVPSVLTTALEARIKTPVRSPIQAYLEDLHADCAVETSGELATYIPELAAADPDWFGICVATVDGRVYEVGDARQRFTIQSMSKPLTYGLALEERGRARVSEKVGVEPSGDAFNSISLEPETGRPLNPMINAGALSTSALIGGDSYDERLLRLLDTYSRYAGRQLSVDQRVFESERVTGHRNRAIGHMLRTFDILTEDPDAVLDLYFSQCAVSVDCRDLSLMAATLANAGINPITGERALRMEFVAPVLSVMTTCGMYDAAGDWVDGVGMPAKSGVSGGILAVLPGQLGVCVFSPRLDPHGSSARGVRVCRRLSRDLGLHFLDVARSSRSTVRASYDIAGVPSKRWRSPAERALLDEVGSRAVVYELHGDMLFAGVELVVRAIVERSPELDMSVVDLRATAQIGSAAARLLLELRRSMRETDKELVFVESGTHEPFARAMQTSEVAPLVFADLDAATEWCEERLITMYGGSSLPPPAVELADQLLCQGVDTESLVYLDGLLDHRSFRDGEAIIRAGDAAAEIFLLMRGEVTVSVSVAAPDGAAHRLATLSAGMAFGELAAIGQSVRSADVTAHGPVEVLALSSAAFERLGETRPGLQAALLRNMLGSAYDHVDRLTREVASLGRAI